MKLLINIFTTLVLFAALISCEKVIDVDLNETEPEIVIEAVLHENDNDFVVSITKTSFYFDNQPSETIDGATVLLTDSKNNSYDILGIGNGQYHATVNASSNTEYYLEVDIEGVAYFATSYLPEKIELDSLYAIYEEGTGPREEGYTVFFTYTDPANVSNYYRVTHSLNGEYQNRAGDLQVFNDNANDGNQARFPIIMKTFEEGDVVEVSLLHFDEAPYAYFNSLGDIIGGGMGPNSGSAAPGNPSSNWSNKALGYFSAYSVDTVSIVIGE